MSNEAKRQLLENAHFHTCKVCGFDMPCWEENGGACEKRIKSGARVCTTAQKQKIKTATAYGRLAPVCFNKGGKR